MESIKSFSLVRLRNDEAYGFHTTVIDGFKYLPKDPEEGVSPIKTEKDTYQTAFDELDRIYKRKGSLDEVAETDNADAAADEAWGAAYAYLKAMVRAPEETMRNYAATLLEEFKKYGNPTHLPQLQELGVLQNLNKDLNEYDLDTLNGCNFDMWLENLKEKTEEFQDKVTRRSEAASRREKGDVQAARDVLEEAYCNLIDRINVVAAYEKTDDYDTFARFMNALINRQITILKTRTTINGNKDDEKEDKPILPEEPEEPETPQEPDKDDDKFPDGGDFEEIPVTRK